MFEAKKLSSIIERVIEVGILFLVILTPLPFGSVQPWAVSTLEVIVYVLGICWFIQVFFNRESFFIKITPFGWFLVSLAAIASFQILPFPQTILRSIAPKTAQVYKESGSVLFNAYPVSLYSYETMKEFFRYMAYLIFYILVVNRRSEKFFLIALALVVGVTFFEAFYGLIELWSGHLHIFGYENISQDKHAFGTFVNRNHYVAFLEMGILTSIGLLVSKITSTLHFQNYKELIFETLSEKNIPCIFIIFFSCIAIAAAFFSGSRSGITIIMFGIVLYLFLSLLFYGRRIKKFLITIVITLSVGSAFWIVRGDTYHVINRFGTILHQRNFRFDIFQDSLNLVKDFFVFGTGFGTYQYVFPHYQLNAIVPPQLHSYVDHAHNEYLELFCEGGFVSFSILLIGGLFTLIAASRDVDLLKLGVLIGLVCISLHNFVDFSFHIPAIVLMYLFLLGFISVYKCNNLEAS